jgi:hypothetical protein
MMRALPGPTERTTERSPPSSSGSGPEGREDGYVDHRARAELSDARRSILHRQERDALDVLAAGKTGRAGKLLEDLRLRTELLELAVLKQSREIADLKETTSTLATLVEALAGAGGAVQPDDPRHVDVLNARLESVELWILRSTPPRAVG